jgi:hypothetical protein
VTAGLVGADRSSAAAQAPSPLSDESSVGRICRKRTTPAWALTVGTAATTGALRSLLSAKTSTDPALLHSASQR